MGNLFDELKRRNVFRVGMVYAIVGWLLVQVTSIAVPAFAMPGWVTTVVFYFVLVGFPVALLFAWAFELTPEGLRPTGEVDLNTSTTVQTGQKLNYLIAVALVLALGFIAYQNIGPKPDTDPTRTQIAETQTSIAVLPFADLSPEGDQEYFSDGISEELLNVLVRIEGLRVASRTSAFAFKGGDRNIVEIANVLGVNHVLEGSVRKAGDRVWITAQLIDAETDTHMWSETYDRGLTDIFAIQDEIAGAIVAALRETLGITIEKTETVGPEDQARQANVERSMALVVGQIMLVDIVFSLDSVVTAVGIAKHLWVMVVAIVMAVCVMMLFAKKVGDFVTQNPSMQILALSFLLLIGVFLVAEGLDQHVSKGYIYFAMGFSLLVELMQLRRRRGQLAKSAAAAAAAAAAQEGSAPE